MGLKRLTSNSTAHTDLHKPNNKFVSAKLEHFWCMDSPWANKTHHSPNLKEATTFPLIIFFVTSHGANTQMSFVPRDSQVGVSKFPKLGFSWFYRPITLCVNLQLKWCLKQSCSPCQDIFNNVWHATFMQGSWGDSLFLMVGSQIVNLTPGPSFGHNL
jgi:hypothetical protein